MPEQGVLYSTLRYCKGLIYVKEAKPAKLELYIEVIEGRLLTKR
jgi:hypothetical protein